MRKIWEIEKDTPIRACDDNPKNSEKKNEISTFFLEKKFQREFFNCLNSCFFSARNSWKSESEESLLMKIGIRNRKSEI